MIHTESIKLNKEFRKLYYRGKVQSSPFVVLYYLPDRNLKGKSKLGFTVSTKVGKAVVRNKIRRWMREAYISFEPKLKTGYSIVMLARKDAPNADFWKIKKSIGGMLKKAEIFLPTCHSVADKKSKKMIIKLIKFYQSHRPKRLPCCRFCPSCSEYMVLSIKKYGIKGVLKGLWRIARCNPFNKNHGIDYP
jgi:ribonuclease P protein component